MGSAHTGNQGYIGKSIDREFSIGPGYGVWQQSTIGLNLENYNFVDPTPISTDLGGSHDEPDTNREYIYGSRNIRIFYTDAYGTTTHIDQTSGTTPTSYTDARLIGISSDAVGTSFLVNNNDSKVGYKWTRDARIKGFQAHGQYSSTTFTNQGSLDVLTWDGTTWTELETAIDVTAGGALNWGTSTIQQYNFVGGAVVCKGLAIQANNIVTYWPIGFFAPIDVNNNRFLGHT